MSLRLLRETPLETDYPAAVLDTLKATRAGQNAMLIKLARGESDAVPFYQRTILPPMPREPEGVRLDAPPDHHMSPDGMLKSKCHSEFRHWIDEDKKQRTSLAERGIVVPTDKPLAPLLERYQNTAQGITDKLQAAVDAGEDLYFNPLVPKLAGLMMFVARFGLKYQDLMK